MTPLHMEALHKGDDNQHAIQLLADFNATIDKENNCQLTPFWYAVEANEAGRVNQLLNLGSAPQLNSIFTSTLHIAVFNLGKDILETLLKTGANPDIVDRDGKTALSWAGKIGSDNEELEIIRLLLDYGARTNLKDHFGQAIYYANWNIGTSNMLQMRTNGSEGLLCKKGRSNNTEVFKSLLLSGEKDECR